MGLRLAQAVAASAAVPGFFPDFVPKGDYPCLNGRQPRIVDGGVYENTGMEPFDQLRPDRACIVALKRGRSIPHRFVRANSGDPGPYAQRGAALPPVDRATHAARGRTVPGLKGPGTPISPPLQTPSKESCSAWPVRSPWSPASGRKAGPSTRSLTPPDWPGWPRPSRSSRSTSAVSWSTGAGGSPAPAWPPTIGSCSRPTCRTGANAPDRLRLYRCRGGARSERPVTKNQLISAMTNGGAIGWPPTTARTSRHCSAATGRGTWSPLPWRLAEAREPACRGGHDGQQLIVVAVAQDHACALPGRSLVCQPE